MKLNSKLSILAIFLVAILAIGAVSAAEDVAIDDSVASVDEDAVVADVDEIDVGAAEEEVLTEGDTYTMADIENAVNNAQPGATIDLVQDGVYNVGTSELSLTKENITIKGHNTTINVQGTGQTGSAAFNVKGLGITIEGIIFNNTDGQKTYGQAVKGVPVQLSGNLQSVKDCQLLYFNKGVMCNGATNAVISGCYITGSTQAATGIGSGESGTYGVAGGKNAVNITVENNTFYGQMLDGISFYSSSQIYTIKNNTFYENVYAIYFGGASTKGSVITENRFINCGVCYDANGDVLVYTEDYEVKDKQGNVVAVIPAGTAVQGLTVISAEKAAEGYSITNNEFVMVENGYAIKTQSGNTAHGYPSSIGDINITGNTVTAGDGVDASTITFVHILSNSGPLNPYAPIVITGNTFDAGITPVTVWLKDWDAEGGVVIPATPKAATFISVEKVATADNQITVKLEDTNGNPLADKTITYTINGELEQTVVTGADGTAIIGDLTDGEIALAYAGDDQTQECTATVTFQSTASPKLGTELVAENMETTAIDASIEPKTGEYFVVTLKDSEGTLLEGKVVQIGFLGVVYGEEDGLVTDENGQVKLQINLGYKGDYTFALCFLGDDQYNASFKVCKINVSPQKGSLTVPNKSYSASAKTKTVTATFKSASGKVVANKKITFTVNGKTYTATTNAKGVASVNVSLTKKGTYTVTAKFATNSMYDSMTATGKLTIK